MATPKNTMNLNYVNAIVKNTLTNDDIKKDGLNQNSIKEKYSGIEKIKNEIDQKIGRINAIFGEEMANDRPLNTFENNIQNIKRQVAYIKDELNNRPDAANQIQLNLDVQLNTLKEAEENPVYLALKKKKQELAQEKRKNLIEIRDGLRNFIQSNSNIEKDENNLKAIQEKIKKLNEFIALNKFDNNTAIVDLVDFGAEIEVVPAATGVMPVRISVKNAFDDEIIKQNEFAEVKANLILNLNKKINDLFNYQNTISRNGKVIKTIYNVFKNNADLTRLINYFELITQDSKNQKVHQQTLKTLREFKAENDDGSSYKFVSENIDLASLADGIIKIYYDGRDLVKEYRKLLAEYNNAPANSQQQIDIGAKLYDQLEKLKKFDQKYQIDFDFKLDIDGLFAQGDNFLQAIDDKFTIGIHAINNIKNLEYLGTKPSLTQKANVFKTLNFIGGDLIAEDEFWKDKGYFVDPAKKWWQFQSKNGELIGSKVIVRVNCDDPSHGAGKKCIRVFYDENMRSCTNKLMKNSDFKNQTIVESPYWAPDSWVRTSRIKDQNGKVTNQIEKIFNDEKMMVFLDDIQGFAVALKKIQVQDPNDPTKIVEVLRPTLFFNERHQKIMESGDDAQKSKLLNKVQKLYKDFVFKTFDQNTKKIPFQLTMKDLIQNAEFMSFDQTHQKLSQVAGDKVSETYNSTKSFAHKVAEKGKQIIGK